jgi:hypothetical protein
MPKLQERGLLQIRGVDPAIIRQFRVWCVAHDTSGASAFTQAFLLLSKKPPKKEEREKKRIGTTP